MKLAIVGTSGTLSEYEERNARQLIANTIRYYNPDFVISGGSKGIDTMALEVALGLGFKTECYPSSTPHWEHGYKPRNIKIATESDVCISITTQTKKESCYHCNQPHQRTGGCWTVKYAKILGKDAKVFLI